MRRSILWSLAAIVGLAFIGPGRAMAEPISYLAGSVYHFSLTSSGVTPVLSTLDPPQPMRDGRIYVNLGLGPADMSFRNAGPVPAVPATFQNMSFAFWPVPVPFPGGYTGQVLYPQNFASDFKIAFASGSAKFSANITMGSVIIDDGEGGSMGLGSASLNPFPATPPGKNGLTLLGTVVATDNQSAEDLSLFGPDSGGLFALTLLVDNPEFNFADFLNNAGTIDGLGAFQLIGGISTGTNIPEPVACLIFGAMGGLGIVIARRARKSA